MPSYSIESGCFTITNGINRYGRPLYGQYGIFYVYAGDRPEWALSRPGKTGNLLIGIARGNQRKWLVNADHIHAKYCPGFYRHIVRDRLLGKAILTLTSLAMTDADGLLVKVSVDGVLNDTEIIWAFGGVREIENCAPVDFDTCGYTHESHFFPKPEDSEGNRVKIAGNTFVLTVPFPLGSPKQATAYQATKKLYHKLYAGVTGTDTASRRLAIVHARVVGNDVPIISNTGSTPAILGRFQPSRDNDVYIGLKMMNKTNDRLESAELPAKFAIAFRHHEKIRNQVVVHTPDEQLNAVVPALAASMDAMWDPPYIVHGGIHCHTPFLGWRHTYGATTFGWWDRAMSHFRAFARTQHKTTPPGCDQPRMDEKYGLARQAEQSIIHSKGFIWGHSDTPMTYNMQEVFIDMLLRQLLYSGDLRFMREMYPVIKLHLEWEKRCFDPDGDGLYENFANTHISDAHSYNGAGCAQASAYTYYANKMMARLTEKLGKDGKKYTAEAARIKRAMDRILWMREKGTYAECRDLIGLRRRNESPELPSIYHPVDSEVPDYFQTWQMLEYTRHTFEHVRCGQDRGYLVWSCNWVPWFWSTKQLMLNETCHLALSAWQAGHTDIAYEYFMGSTLNSMLETRSPGGCIGTSPMDKHHPGLATDFPCGTGMACRALVEGLFGIRPDLLENRVLIRPGFPESWDHADITTPYLQYNYKRERNDAKFHFRFSRPVTLTLEAPCRFDAVPEVIINGKQVKPHLIPGIKVPYFSVTTAAADTFDCIIRFAGRRIEPPVYSEVVVAGAELKINWNGLLTGGIRDPQGCVASFKAGRIKLNDRYGRHTFFVKVRRNKAAWWQPISVDIRRPFEFLHSEYCKHTNTVYGLLRNNFTGIEQKKRIILKALPRVPGTYTMTLPATCRRHKFTAAAPVAIWDLPQKPDPDLFRTIDISGHMNLDIEFMFQQKYRKPRSPYCSLQLPETGYGEWCGGSHRTPPRLSSLYFSRRVDLQKRFITPQGIPFHSPNWKWHNAIMTSQWDNFPAKVSIRTPKVSAERLYFLVAGSANAMYSQMDVGLILIRCSDGSTFRLPLHSPNNFWPIWDDFDKDADAFSLPETPPQRVLIGENTWANLLDIEIGGKLITNVDFQCLANETIIGLMGITAYSNLDISHQMSEISTRRASTRPQ